MGKKIAIIATDFLEQFIKDMITELDMGFQYHIFTYEKFEDIKDIYKKIGPEYDGILASGSFPAHMIHLYYPEEKRPIGCFNTDDTAMYRLLLKLLQQNRKLDFRRVYADIMELFGGNLTAFVEGREIMPNLTIFSNETFTLERMQKLEEEQYEKHLNLWKEGKTEIFNYTFFKHCKEIKRARSQCIFSLSGTASMYKMSVRDCSVILKNGSWKNASHVSL